MKKIIYLLVIIILIIINFIGCNSIKDESAIIAETVIAPMADIKVSETEINEIKTFNQQLGGVNETKNEFFIIDYLSEHKKKIIVKFVDMESGEIKRVKKINYGDTAAPGMFAPIIARINYSDNKYYILNDKISELNNDFEYQTCFMNRKFIFECIDYFTANKESKIVFANHNNLNNDGFYGTTKLVEILIGTLKKGNPLSIINKKIAKFTFSSKKQPSTRVDKTHVVFNLFYFIPKVFCFTKKDKIYFTESTKQGYYIYNLKNNKKQFIKIPWLKKKNFTDKDALNIGTHKKEHYAITRKKRGGLKGKTFYKSFKEKSPYLVWLLNIEQDKLAIISNVDTDKKILYVDFIKADTGKYIESVKLPMGAHFSLTLYESRPSFPQLYINYEKRLYIYGDKDDDWNELVRYCKFKVNK